MHLAYPASLQALTQILRKKIIQILCALLLMRITSLCFTYPFKRTQWKYYDQERKYYFLVKARCRESNTFCLSSCAISMEATVYMLRAQGSPGMPTF